MKRFSDFQPNVDLNESLDTAVEFYLTDDTKVPQRITAAFQIGDTQYGMSLEQTNFKKTYSLRFYMLGGKVKKNWRFKNKSHILPCLSTLFKFMEASIPFIPGQQFDAFVVEYGKKIPKKRMETFAKRLIKKSYINKFRLIPTEGEMKTGYQWMFIANKKKNPSQIFTSKIFKDLKFDPQGPLPQEVYMAHETVLPEKPTATLKPSKKFTLGSTDVEVDYEPEYDDVAKKVLEVKPLPVSDKPDKEEKKEAEAPFDPIKALKNSKAWDDMEVWTNQPHHFFMHKFPSAAEKIRKFGYDESKVNKGDLTYVMNQVKSNNPGWYEFVKDKFDFYDSNGEPNVDAALKMFQKYAEWWKTTKEKSGEEGALSALTTFNDVLGNINDAFENQYKYVKNIKTKKDKEAKENSEKTVTLNGDIEISELKTNVPTQEIPAFDSNLNFVKQESESMLQMVDHFDKVYYKKINQHKNYNQIEMYTGEAFDMYNTPLRGIQKYLAENKGEISEQQLKDFATHVHVNNRIMKLWQVFKDLPPAPEPFWVYRNSFVGKDYSDIKPGDDIADAAFLSTSLAQNVGIGGPDKFAIYVPKGTPIIPVLNQSEHSSEREILLPPMSVLKVMRVQRQQMWTGKYKFAIHAMYTGNAMEGLTSYLKSNTMSEAIRLMRMKEMIALEEQKKEKETSDKKYDPNKKFGGTFEKNVSKALSKLAKKGKLKK